MFELQASPIPSEVKEVPEHRCSGINNQVMYVIK